MQSSEADEGCPFLGQDFQRPDHPAWLPPGTGESPADSHSPNSPDSASTDQMEQAEADTPKAQSVHFYSVYLLIAHTVLHKDCVMACRNYKNKLKTKPCNHSQS